MLPIVSSGAGSTSTAPSSTTSSPLSLSSSVLDLNLTQNQVLMPVLPQIDLNSKSIDENKNKTGQNVFVSNYLTTNTVTSTSLLAESPNQANQSNRCNNNNNSNLLINIANHQIDAVQNSNFYLQKTNFHLQQQQQQLMQPFLVYQHQQQQAAQFQYQLQQQAPTHQFKINYDLIAKTSKEVKRNQIHFKPY